jgi:hypothetical protein
MKPASLMLLLCASLSGCDPAVTRTITVHAPAITRSASASDVSVAGVSESDVRDTIAVVQRVVLARGFHRVEPFHNPGVVASFLGEYHPDGSTPGCHIYRLPEKGIVQVELIEWARFSSSDIVRELQHEVFAALTEHFGSDRVTQR